MEDLLDVEVFKYESGNSLVLNYKGKFLDWGVEGEEDCGSTTVALVLKPDGMVDTVYTNRIRFLTLKQ